MDFERERDMRLSIADHWSLRLRRYIRSATNYADHSIAHYLLLECFLAIPMLIVRE